MVGMEMGGDDQIDRIAVDAEPLHRDQRRGAAIDKEIYLTPDHMKASVEPPPRSEGVAAADELNVHARALNCARRHQARRGRQPRQIVNHRWNYSTRKIAASLAAQYHRADSAVLSTRHHFAGLR